MNQRAAKLDTGIAPEYAQDMYFLDREAALHIALRNMPVPTGAGGTRIQICYHDGDPLDCAPLNMINVPSNSFANFFTSHFLEIPRAIICRADMDNRTQAAVHEAFRHMLDEIEVARAEHIQKWEGYPHHRDSYFLDARLAYQTALQGNRVFVKHPTKTGLQVCYYDGDPIENAPPNLVHAPAERLLDILSNCRTRLPTRIVYPARVPLDSVSAGIEAFNDLLLQAHANRENAAHEFARYISETPPVFTSGKPLRIFFIGDHRTQVLQYVSKNLAKTFEKLGHITFMSMEKDDTEEIDAVWHLKEAVEFAPQVYVNLNNRNNNWLHPDIFNVIWFQDPTTEIQERKPLYWRDRDLIYSISPEIDQYLRDCGASTITRQFSCIDHEVFTRLDGVQRKSQAVFIGSSYVKNVYRGPGAAKIIARLKEAMEAGELIDKALCDRISREFNAEPGDVWPYTANYVIRDTVVRWLCENPHIPVEVYGRYWESDPIVAPHFKGELEHGPQVAHVYNQSKYAISALTIAINSQRLAELAGCGCIPVVYDTREAADKPHWDNECLFFKTREELYACLTRTPPGDPAAIAEAYRYDTLAKDLLKQIEARLSGA